MNMNSTIAAADGQFEAEWEDLLREATTEVAGVKPTVTWNPSGGAADVMVNAAWNLQQPQVDPNQRLRRVRWTWNNYTQEEVARLSDPSLMDERIDYMIFGFEVCPSSGTPHLQGYTEFRVVHSIKTARERLGGGKVWCLPCDKARDANINYCVKMESKDPSMLGPDGTPLIVEWAREGRAKTRGEGSSKDKCDAWKTRLDLLQKEPDLMTFAKSNPDMLFKHGHNVKMMCDIMKDAKLVEKLKERFPENLRLRKWQRAVVEMLKEPADDRTIIWFYDEKGCSGKTLLTKWLAIHMGACTLTNGRSQDIAYAYQGEDVILFDFTRTMEDRINYQVLEQIKDGKVFSPKYGSKSKLFVSPWVIVFSNRLPDFRTMTSDKWSPLDISTCMCGMETEEGDHLVDLKIPSSKAYIMGNPILRSMMMYVRPDGTVHQ